MTTLHTIVLLVHVLIGLTIVGLVLIQRGKGAEAGAAFGAGASGTVFGARGSSNFLSRSTALLAALFFVTSLSLAYLGAQRRPPTSLLEGQTQGEPQSRTQGSSAQRSLLPSVPDERTAPAGELPAASPVPAQDSAQDPAQGPTKGRSSDAPAGMPAAEGPAAGSRDPDGQ